MEGGTHCWVDGWMIEMRGELSGGPDSGRALVGDGACTTTSWETGGQSCEEFPPPPKPAWPGTVRTRAVPDARFVRASGLVRTRPVVSRSGP